MPDTPISLFEIPIMGLQPELEKIRQRIAYALPEWIVDPSTAALLAFRNQRPYTDMALLAQRGGLNADQFGLLVDALRQYPTLENLFAAYFRGIVDETEKDAILGALGYSDRDKEIVSKSSVVIPGVQDTIRFLTRDVFIPEFVEAFGMDKELPELAFPAFARLGMEKDSVINLWRGHWELPGLGQAFQMYQRDKIDETALRRLMRAQGVEPYWRDPLIAIAYNPLTRVDIRRIHKLLGKDRAWLVRQYKNTGYDDENAQTLADFTIAYNSPDKQTALKDLTDGLKTQVVSGVVSGAISEDEGRAYLLTLGYDESSIAAFFSVERLLRASKIRERIAELTGDLYVKTRATEAEARSALAAHGFGNAEIDLRIQEWDIERKLKATAANTDKERDLTKAEILDAYKDHISTREQTVSDLTKMRYSPAEVDQLIALADYTAKKADVKDQIEIVHEKLLRHEIDEIEATTDLDKIGLTVTHRDALINSWMRVVEHKAFSIPLSTLQAFFAANIRTEEETYNSIIAMGASDKDATDLITLWSEKANAAAARAATTAANLAAKGTTAKKG